MADEERMTIQDQRKMQMYTGLANFRNNEVSLRWQRSLLMIVLNTAGLPFLNIQTATPFLYQVLGVSFLLLCAYWLTLNWKTQLWINYWQGRLALVDPPESNLLEFRVFTGTEWERVNQRPTFHQLLNVLPVAFMVVWFSVLVSSLWVSPKEDTIMRINQPVRVIIVEKPKQCFSNPKEVQYEITL